MFERPGSRAEVVAAVERAAAAGRTRARRGRRALVHRRRCSPTARCSRSTGWTACSTPTRRPGSCASRPGSRCTALSRELHVRGLALPNLGDIDAQSVAGAIATGTHGTGARLPNLSAQVEAVELVLGDGSARELTAADGDLLRAARVGLGALGVVVAVTLRCVPAFRLRGVDRPEPLEDVLGVARRARGRRRPLRVLDVPALAAGAHAHQHAHRRAERDAPGRARDVDRGRPDGQPRVRRCSTASARRFPRAIPRAQPLAGARGLAARARRLVVPRSSPARGSCASRRWSTRSRAQPRPRRCAAPARSSSATRSRSRSSCASSPADDALLSPAHGRDSAYVAVHVFEGMPWEAPFREVEALMGSLGGRPHWGKWSFLTAAELAPRYPAWDAFQAARRGARSRRPVRERMGAPRARRGASEERAALAAVGRDGRHAAAALDEVQDGRSARTARPPWRGASTRGRRSAGRPRPGRAAASGPRRRPPGGRAAGRAAGGAGEAVAAGGPGRGVAAAERGRHARGRPPDHRQREERGGPRRERAVGVEQRRRRAGPSRRRPRSPPARRRCARSIPVPPPLTNRSGATARTAATTAARRAASSRAEARCIAAQGGAAAAGCRAAGRRRRRSAPRTSSARPAPARAARRSRAPAPRPARACAAASAWRRSARGRRAATSRRRRRCTRAPGRRARGRDQVELLAAVDHHGDPLARGAVRQLAQRRAIDGRVGDHHVVAPCPGQPQRLGQREREDARAGRRPARGRRAPGSAPTSTPAARACRRRGAAGRRRWRRTRRGRRPRTAGRGRGGGVEQGCVRKFTGSGTLSAGAALECRASFRDITPSPRAARPAGTGEPVAEVTAAGGESPRMRRSAIFPREPDS